MYNYKIRLESITCAG